MRALLLLLVLAVPAVGSAQDSVPPRDDGVIHVYGHVPHPATIFLTRARVRFDRVDASHHAVDRIVDSVRHAPF